MRHVDLCVQLKKSECLRSPPPLSSFRTGFPVDASPGPERCQSRLVYYIRPPGSDVPPESGVRGGRRDRSWGGKGAVKADSHSPATLLILRRPDCQGGSHSVPQRVPGRPHQVPGGRNQAPPRLGLRQGPGGPGHGPGASAPLDQPAWPGSGVPRDRRRPQDGRPGDGGGRDSLAARPPAATPPRPGVAGAAPGHLPPPPRSPRRVMTIHAYYEPRP